MSETKFYKCNECGNLLTMIIDAGPAPVCCGSPMELLQAGVTDGAAEKHVPVIEKPDERHVVIKVGAAAHPMLDEHYIQWVAIVQGAKTQIKKLKPGKEPQAKFSVKDNAAKPITAYEYCNLHGLWKAES
ncbi:MAG: desulfoferrodoxin [Clostridiales Family XIII bacterium]|jgi:superoxide reductase|nr:desulfoferrodoxin [Clostridiales Family XIII bacterium]